MSENVKIPVSLMNDTIDILESLRDMTVVPDFRDCVDSVLFAFQRKKDSMALRETYAQIVNAIDEDSRFAARMRYLEERRRLKDHQ